MRFLMDESTGPLVAEWLGEQGHEVFSVYDLARGMDDDDIVENSRAEALAPILRRPIARTICGGN